MFETLNTIADILFTFLRSALLAFFACKYFDPRWFHRKWGNVTVFAISRTLLQIILFDPWDSYEQADIGVLGKQLMYLVTVFLWILLFYKTELHMGLLISVVFMSIADICLFLSNEWLILSSKQLSRFDPLLDDGRVDVDTYLFYVHLTAFLCQLVFYLLHLVITAIILRMIVRRFSVAHEKLHRDEYCFLFIPSFAFWLICQLLRMVMMTIDDDGFRLLYDDHPMMIVIVPVICVVMISTILLDMQVFQTLRNSTRERSDRLIMENQIHSLESEILMINGKNDSLRRFRHDIRNHLAVLSSLRNKDEKEYNEYFARLTQEIVDTDAAYHTGNIIADTLLSVMQERAYIIDRSLVIDASGLVIPENLRIEDYDLGILLSNALDNAIEACERMKRSDSPTFIRVWSEMLDDMFFLKISNSYAGESPLCNDAGFPLTVKLPAEEHGFGMENMRRVIDKCHGGIEFKAESGVFTLIIMLQTNVDEPENNL